jgi:hypothetical protein
MIITAYSITRSADATDGFVAIGGTSPDYVPVDTRIYTDALFSNFIETSDGESWVYVATDPINTTVPDYPGLQTYAAVTKNPLIHYALATYDGEGMNFYIPATKVLTPWAHSGGQFYPISAAPAGAYPITEFEYNLFNYYVAQGIELQWYSNQRPYVTKPWTQPIFTDSYVAPDGSRAAASNEDVSRGRLAYKAMNGQIGGDASTCWSTDNEFDGWWRVDFPYKIALSKLTHYNVKSVSSAAIRGQYFTDETLITPIGEQFYITGEWESIILYDSPENPIMTRGIYFQKVNSNRWSGIGELVLEATSMTHEAGEGR